MGTQITHSCTVSRPTPRPAQNALGGYRTSHVARAVTVGNEAPVPGLAGKVPSGSVPATPAWPSPTHSSATTTPSATSRS